jgi:mono/diheme cytochrome c family protein
MNKQRNMLLEMIVLAAVIGGLCFLLWNVNFYPVKPSKPTTNSTPAIPKDADWAEGKLLYRSYCNSCHKPTENSLGPVLIGATQRWRHAGSFKGKTGDEWLKAWVRDWKDVVAAGYPYGVAMAKSRQAEMNMFINLTDKQIDQILHYADDPRPGS